MQRLAEVQVLITDFVAYDPTYAAVLAVWLGLIR